MLRTGSSGGNNSNNNEHQAEAKTSKYQSGNCDGARIITTATRQISLTSAPGAVAMIIVDTLHASSSIGITRPSLTSAIIIVQAARRAHTALGGALDESAFNTSPVSVRAARVIFALYATTFLYVAIRHAAVGTVDVERTVVYTQTNICVAVRLVGANTAGRTIHRATSVSRRGTIVALTINTTVRKGRLAIRVGCARSTNTRRLTDRLSRDLSSIENTTVSVGSTSLAGTISLAVLASRATSVGRTRAYADSGSNVANGLVGNFPTVALAVGVGCTSLADAILHAVVTWC